MSIGNKEIEKIIIDILKYELNLTDDYGRNSKNEVIPTFIIGAQNSLIGYTDKLQIVIQSTSATPISNTKYHKTDVDGKVSEIKESTYIDDIQIDLLSKSPNNDARTRRFEVLAALASDYSQQMQEKYNCRIFRVPQGVFNTSSAEGGSNVNRYTISCRTSYQRIYTREVDYYNDFLTEVGKDGIINEEHFEIVSDEVITT